MGEGAEFEGPCRQLHRPVMCREILDFLNPSPGQSLLDLTAGTGGHSLLLAERLGADGLIVGMDADESALKTARRKLEAESVCDFRLFQGRFSQAMEVLEKVNISGFDLIIADLGVGTHQLDDEGRGFSYESDSPPDMRFDPSEGRSALEVINEEPQESLADILYHFGQERFSRPIASGICRRRMEKPLESAREVAEIIKKVYAARTGGKKWRIHPATRTFMALRIYVNDELGELEKILELFPRLVGAGARAAIITYHSLEARRVKTAWRRQEKEGVLELVTPKPVKPDEREVAENPRARSAQLRVARFSKAARTGCKGIKDGN